jgi:lysyl-tRNA synthetase class 2
MSIPDFNEIIEANDQTEARREHLEKLRELVGNVYPNKFERSKITGAEDTISNVLHFAPVANVAKEIKEHISALNEGEKPAPELKEKLNAQLKEFGTVKVSGRLTTTPRTMGKAAFVHLSDGVNRLQIYVRRDDIKGIANDGKNSEINGWELFKLLDGGDFVGVGGFLFLTNTGELSIHVETLQFLSKALLPMPDKIHGIADPELNRRHRYADLIASSLRNKTDEEIEEENRTGVKELTTREVFERRARLISGMRRYLDDNDFVEVETPMLTPKATGAAAKPFQTHHNALDITLYARIAPELYLKRLTVGGFEKVYELNRNFRNEGLSNKHNPEFTMLEFYCAYMDVNGMMDFSEVMIKESVRKATGGSLQVKYGENEIDFSKFERLTMEESLVKEIPQSYLFEILGAYKYTFDIYMLQNEESLSDITAVTKKMIKAAQGTGLESLLTKPLKEIDKNSVKSKDEQWNETREILNKIKEIKRLNVTEQEIEDRKNELIQQKQFGRQIEYLFENFVESNLIQPTFIIDYPKSISPLSKASPDNPNVAERFELFINGMECANGFSELNDPQEQYERFRDQMRERETGDEEAMVLDEDYIRALAYGMPPAAGIGIGIDRLVMLLTNRHSIRDVILFPHMRPEKREEENTED